MDPAPGLLAERERDPELGLPLPFACGTVGFGAPRDGSTPTLRRLDGRRVTQCALSRVCGVCGAVLGRPLAFLGTPTEAGRNAFHFPASHLECAQALRDEIAGLDVGVLGQAAPVETWVVSTAAAFEYVRPGRDDTDRRPTFQPYEVLTESR